MEEYSKTIIFAFFGNVLKSYTISQCALVNDIVLNDITFKVNLTLACI